jgi:hypothetical protein
MRRMRMEMRRKQEDTRIASKVLKADVLLLWRRRRGGG